MAFSPWGRSRFSRPCLAIRERHFRLPLRLSRSRNNPGAVTPVPDSLSEYQFAGLLRARDRNHTLYWKRTARAATAEMVLEGHILPSSTRQLADASGSAPAGAPPALIRAMSWHSKVLGDHTGYYNERDWFRFSPSSA